MIRVCGLDVSLAKTGVALLESPTDDVWSLTTYRIPTSPHPKGDTRALRDRMVYVRQSCSVAAEHATLVVMEGPSFASVGSSSKDLMGLWWLVYDRLCEQGMPVLEVPPSSLKKWATGKGNAGKGQVAVGVSRTFPLDRFLVDFAQCDDNEVDAAALCGVGAQHLGWDVPIGRPGYRDQVLGSLRSPSAA